MAAAYLFHLCRNHPFLDGNKRAGANAAITFLLLNGWGPRFEEDELVAMVLSVASGTVSKPELIRIFESRCRRRSRGDKDPADLGSQGEAG